MFLYLIRHADAVPMGQDNVSTDEARPLTETGKAQAQALAKTLQGHGVHLDAVLHSPLLRSQQTALGLVEHWNTPAPSLLECGLLAPGGREKKLARELRGLTGESLALVGHMPDLATLAGWLIGSKKAQIDLAKSGVACIELPDRVKKGEGVLKWLVTDAWMCK
jgi:phosphohistidine phosphatase